MDPPYQRRSVWNQRFRSFFIETVLLDYPSPPIFLHEDIRSDGSARYAVIDGKQRLTSVFDFVQDLFPIADDSVLENFRGSVFSQLGEDTKTGFWRYQFPVEFVPSVDEALLTSIFDRINRNVARLTAQELRHAKYSGEFASSAEDMTVVLDESLPPGIPRIAGTSRKQMKDVEFTAQLLLLTENGPQTFSQEELDQAYSDRDDVWDERRAVERRFRGVVAHLQHLFSEPVVGTPKARRLANQADFYSLFGALLSLDDGVPPSETMASRLSAFMEAVVDSDARDANEQARLYYDATRSASNDLRRRRDRIQILKAIIEGE